MTTTRASDEVFAPVWWARSGFAQTVATAFDRRRHATSLRLQDVDLPDGDRVRSWWADAPDANAPLVLLLHGLEGSRDSVYAVETARLCAQRGFGFVVLEFRSCGGVMNRARRTYHSGETGDLDFVVESLTRAAPQRPLFTVGFSLGGNVLLKWLGERGDRAPSQLLAAAAVSPPFDLEMAARRCDERYRGLFARHFLRTMVPKALAKERQYPGCLDANAVRRCRTFAAFDDLATAPLHGFRDARHYWTEASCMRFLPAVRRPTLLVASSDDPLIPAEALPRAAAADSRFLVPHFLDRGGHVGFVEGGAPWSQRRWAERRVVDFFVRHCAGVGVAASS